MKLILENWRKYLAEEKKRAGKVKIRVRDISVKDMKLIMKLGLDRELQNLVTDALWDLERHAMAPNKHELTPAIDKVDKIIETVGGDEEAIAIFNQLYKSKQIFIPLVTRFAQKGFDKRMEWHVDRPWGEEYDPFCNKAQTRCAVDRKTREEIREANRLRYAVGRYDQVLGDFILLMGKRMGPEIESKIREIIYGVVDNMGMGATEEEFNQFAQSARDKYSRVTQKAQKEIEARIEAKIGTGYNAWDPEWKEVWAVYPK